MKVALVHDWLNQKVGGAENVFFELCQMYPEADIFTLVYNPKKFNHELGDRKIIKSRLQRLPAFIKSRPKLMLPFIQKSVEKLDFSGYDLVITSSSAWVKNINVPKATKHICYCYSPARMLWDSWPGYIRDMGLGPLCRFYVTRLASKLRLWDYYKSQGPTQLIAISDYVSSRISKFYHQPSKVIYSPVDTEKFRGIDSKGDYFLIISVLSKYKNVDLAVKAFIENGKKLKIAGDGPELNALKLLAKNHGNIEFLGRIEEDEKIGLLKRAKGFIFCSIEDFGITMVEAIASNTAVLALNGGGAKEIVVEGKTGLFFDHPTTKAMNEGITSFEHSFNGNYKLSNQYIFDKFTVKKFRQELAKEINAS